MKFRKKPVVMQAAQWGMNPFAVGQKTHLVEPIGKELWRRRVERDDDYIEALEADLIEFSALVKQNERILRQPSNVDLLKQAA